MSDAELDNYSLFLAGVVWVFTVLMVAAWIGIGFPMSLWLPFGIAGGLGLSIGGLWREQNRRDKEAMTESPEVQQ